MTKGRAFTAYAVTLNNGSSVVWRRFSEFVDLDQRLKATVGAEDYKAMPRLPEKSFFQVNDFAAEVIAKRRVALEAYLKYLVAKGFLQRSSDLVAFLGLDSAAPTFKTTESRDELGESSSGVDGSSIDDDDDDGGAWISSIGESISMKSALCSIFVGLEPDKARVYTTPNIPLDKFKNAKNSTKMPADERPVVLVDLSRGGLCHQAVLFCTRGMYFHYQGLPADIGSGHFDYPALFRERLRVEGSDLHVGPSKILYMKYAGINADALLELLKNLREFVRMKQLALRLNDEEPLRPHSPAVMGGSSAAAPASGAGGAVGQLSPRGDDELGNVLRAVRFLKARAVGAEEEPEHAAIEATWASVLQQAFSQFNETNSVYVGNVPSSKLENALKAINLGNQKPLVFIDNTKLGSGYQAVIFTTHGVYAHTDRVDKGSGKLGWEELLSAPMTQLDKHNVRVGNELVINLAGAALVPAQLLECLHVLTSALQSLGAQLGR